MPSLILIVEDEKILAEAISTYLGRHGWDTMIALSGEKAIRLAEESSPEVALVDLMLPGMDGIELLGKLRDIAPGIEVIMMTALQSVHSAVVAMKQGCFDYLTKPLDLEELRIVAEKASSHMRMRQELSYLKAKEEKGRHVEQIIGESPGVLALRARIEKIAAGESSNGGGPPTVLITGETGTGKELVARAIHYRSSRAAAPFVEINCAALPATLLEAELFGFEKGAYTDAKAAKAGLFEAADGGTLFLDEIGYMDPSFQVKLLKAIEEKSIRRIGSLRSKPINIRIIAATNRNLEHAIAEGSFRSDLYYRIKVLTIHVPPLRARGSDIIVLARHFLDKFASHYGRPVKSLTPEAESRLLNHSWPGNVRELAHVIERAVLLHAGPALTDIHLDLPHLKAKPVVALGPVNSVAVDFSSGRVILEDIEQQLIVKALEASDWNRVRAAELLGISKETLRYRIEKYRIGRAH